MSILAGFGAVPSNLTVPLMAAAVAVSIVAAGAAAGLGAAGCSSVVSFLPHPVSRASASKAERPQTAIRVFFFMLSPYLSQIFKPTQVQTYLGLRLARVATSVHAG